MIELLGIPVALIFAVAFVAALLGAILGMVGMSFVVDVPRWWTKRSVRRRVKREIKAGMKPDRRKKGHDPEI